MLIYLSALVCLIGLVIYLASEKPKPMELGRIAYAMGLLAFLLTIVGDKLVGIAR